MTTMTDTSTAHAPTGEDMVQVCTFWAGGLFFGVGVSDVQEVLRHQVMTPVPGGPPAVRGLINLRGQIVTAVDLRTRLGLEPRPVDEDPMNVVVRSRGEVVSLLVDDIGDVIDCADLPLETPPANLPATLHQALHGVLSLPEPASHVSTPARRTTSILLVLDADRAVDTSTTPPTGGTP